ncbi:MAG: hypothetical protein ACR2HN_04145 [Tepidiformaceae bacterium]
MMEEMLLRARDAELDGRVREMGFRREWACLARVDTLERKLNVARAKLPHARPTGTARAIRPQADSQ